MPETPADFLSLNIPALLLQTGIVVAIIRTTVYFYNRNSDPYTPPAPVAEEAARIYYDKNWFRDALENWEQHRQQHDASEQERIADLHKFVRRMAPFSALTCVFFLFISSPLFGSPLDPANDFKAVLYGLFIVGAATCAEITLKSLRHSKAFAPVPFNWPKPIYKEVRVPKQEPPPPRTEKPPEPPSYDIRITSLNQAYRILELPPGLPTLSEARAAYIARIIEYHPDKVMERGKEIRDLAERKAKEINLAWEFIKRCS